ncbi:MAG: hypothetical protein IPK60_09275 [Sandaracinaceae bacterium]|nr:hypothetical protein [Sandaracinaceae bacterium]
MFRYARCEYGRRQLRRTPQNERLLSVKHCDHEPPNLILREHATREVLSTRDLDRLPIGDVSQPRRCRLADVSALGHRGPNGPFGDVS